MVRVRQRRERRQSASGVRQHLLVGWRRFGALEPAEKLAKKLKAPPDLQPFVLHYDGNCGFLGMIYENHPDVWKRAIKDIYDMGYDEVEEAKAAGLLPPDWEVPQEKRDMHPHIPMEVLREKARELHRKRLLLAIAGPICPHCGRSDNIRSRDLSGYFICNACARSFGHDNLDAIKTIRPVEPMEIGEPAE